MKTSVKIFLSLAVLMLAGVVVHHFFRLPFLRVASEEAIPKHTALVFSASRASLLKPDTAASLPVLLLPANLRSDLLAFEKTFGAAIPLPTACHLLAVVQPVRSGDFDVLFIYDRMEGDLQPLLPGAGKQVRARKSVFRRSEVFTLKTTDGQWALCKYRNLLLFGRNAYLLENAISQLESPSTSPCRDQSFRQAMRGWGGGGAAMDVLVNLQQVNAQFASLLNVAKMQSLQQIGELGSWLRLELPAGAPGARWKAVLSHHPGNRLLEANRRGRALPYKNVFRALPDNLTCFWWLSTQKYQPAAMKSQWRRYFNEWEGSEMAFAVGEPLNDAGSEQFFLIKTSDTQRSEAAMQKFAKNNAATRLPDYEMFKVFQLSEFDFGEMMGIGGGFSNPVCTVLGEYVLLANSRTGLERWLGKYIAGQTYSKDVAFLGSLRALPVQAKGFLYFESGKTWQQAIHFLDDRFLSTLGANPLPFGQLAAVMTEAGPCSEWEVVSPVPDRKKETPGNILWKTPLEAEAATAPTIFQNFKSGETEIFIQDKNHTTYLVSRSGKVLWRRPVNEPILSRVYQLDLYNNREEQFAFSTASGIHVLDALGQAVAGFPLKLQTPATNGMTVVDFFESHEYEFFIACENGSAYGFDENGNPVEGWRPKTGVGKVRFPMVHFQAGGKDYLVLLNEAGDLQVYQKNGEERFPVKKWAAKFPQGPDFQIEKNTGRIVACDQAGRIFVSNLAGEEFRLAARTGKLTNVRFTFADVAGDARKECLSLSGASVWCHGYNDQSAFARIFTDTLPAVQDELFAVSWKKRPKDFIGTLCREKTQISLLDGDGKLLPQFPLAGTTPFSLTDLLGDGKPVVIVGNGNSLYAYALE